MYMCMCMHMCMHKYMCIAYTINVHRYAEPKLDKAIREEGAAVWRLHHQSQMSRVYPGGMLTLTLTLTLTLNLTLTLT